MVWAAIWVEGRSPLVIMKRDEEATKKGYSANSYMWALEEGLLPNYSETRYFQQDNARIHTCEATTAFLLSNKVQWIDWPSHSPDLNPIEHVWRSLKSRLYSMFPHLSGLRRNKVCIAEFCECLQKAWVAIPQDQIRDLIYSMPRRLEACTKAKGWYTSC